jgi:deoxyribonuclease IV
MKKTLGEKLLIGAHTSIAGGLYNAVLEGQKIGATTIQIFTANQRRWEGKAIDQQAIDLWKKTLEESEIKKVMSHDSYLINLGAADSEVYDKSQKAFREELLRCQKLGVSYLNFHPGSSTHETEEQCLNRIVNSLLNMEGLIDQSLCILLEATAGQGSSVGYRFEHLSYIIERVKAHIPIGVCIDTCHIFAAGYDLRTEEACKATFEEFDQIVGLKHLHAFHLNDSLKPLGSRVDRHASLGKGMIGLDCFRFLMTDSRLKNLPKYLETPEGPDVWVNEIQLLRDFAALL